MTLEMPNMVIALLAALIPFIAAAAVKPASSDWWRIAIAVLASGVLAVAGDIVNDEVYQLEALIGSFITALLVSLGSYQMIGKTLRINERIAPGTGV